MAKQISKFETFISPLLRRKVVRELILLPSTLSGKRFSNKTEDYGVFKASLVSHLDSVAIYVSNLNRSVPWYVEKLGFVHEGTTEVQNHPHFPGYQLRCAYLSSKYHKNALVLVERTDENGKKVPPSTNSFFHIAFEVEDGRTSYEFAKRLRDEGIFISYGPVKHNATGDGESGGNVAVYIFDPDRHYVEFFYDMDTVDNYKERYGELTGSQRA